MLNTKVDRPLRGTYHSFMPSVPEKPQNLKNHTRYDPPFHFVVVPLLLLNLIGMVHLTIHEWPHRYGLHLWWIVMAIVLFLIAGIARSSALHAQDRTIRLEERLRYSSLLTPADLAAAGSLTVRQIVALRFASDPELPALITRTLAQHLTPKQIKQSIITWRPDFCRV